MYISITILFTIINGFMLANCGRTELRRLLLKQKIIPDMIGTAPLYELRVRYMSGVEAQLGNDLTPTSVRYPPSTIHWPTQRNSWYTIIMVDLDDPAASTMMGNQTTKGNRETLHWLVVNMPGNDPKRGQTFAEYIGARPAPNNSTSHRYVLIVYKQSGKIIMNRSRIDSRSISGRTGWKTRDFATEYKLYGPIAINWFHAQYDSYVPILNAQLNGAATLAASASSVAAAVSTFQNRNINSTSTSTTTKTTIIRPTRRPFIRRNFRS
ncbi:hypothetical protein BLOT_014552 [Blomia tropicalis]|nr:hypothetical protein BLOT_014552 [Blomia tropicalis]